MTFLIDGPCSSLLKVSGVDPEDAMEARLDWTPDLEGADCRISSLRDIPRGVSGVVERDEIETVCDVIDAFRLLIEPETEGRGIVEAVEVLENIREGGSLSS